MSALDRGISIISVRECIVYERRIHELLIHSKEAAKYLEGWLQGSGKDQYWWDAIIQCFVEMEQNVETTLRKLDDAISQMEDALEGKYEGPPRIRNPVLGPIVPHIYDRSQYKYQ